ncbi:MAG: T9SS type A sorting domain-containing protein [Candidatus Electryonea clarkiae]|nr:T9SS type A sorting domain-containing protein [Candidatus Electryonea clarkiae]MDP8289235.1 T9SS type A sorting domain-containing protein [Candidatus Electryonea clarkiae]
MNNLPARTRSGKLILHLVVSILLVIILINSALAVINTQIARTNTPGHLYFIKDYEDDEFIGWLAFSTDYGQTAQVFKDSILAVRYQPDLNVIILNVFHDENDYVISNDSGQTFSPFGRSNPFSWELIPSRDSIIAINSHSRYSRDSLFTWNQSRKAGLEGRTDHDRTQALGWSSSDCAVLTDFNNGTSGFYFSESYCDSFYATADLDNSWGATGFLYTGYEPGEYYVVVNSQEQPIFCTTDTGRTWNESGRCPLPPEYVDFFEMEPGWEAGELFILWKNVYIDTSLFYLYYSNDFAQTWELKNSMADPYPNAVSENNSSSLPTFSIQIFPNPTNSMVTIQIPDYSPGNLLLFDNLGRSVQSKTICGRAHYYSMDLKNYPSGFYWVRYTDKNRTLAAKQILLLK